MREVLTNKFAKIRANSMTAFELLLSENSKLFIKSIYYSDDTSSRIQRGYVFEFGYRTYIQRRDSIMARSVIFSVHVADPIAEVKLLISPFLRWSLDYEINYWDFKQL
jgi:hypothetical protein